MKTPHASQTNQLHHYVFNADLVILEMETGAAFATPAPTTESLERAKNYLVTIEPSMMPAVTASSSA